MNEHVNIRTEIKDKTIEVDARLPPWPRCSTKIVVRTSDVVEHLGKEGLKVSEVLTSPATEYLKNYCNEEFLAGTWIFEKVVAKPKKKSYNSSKKKTVSVTPEE